MTGLGMKWTWTSASPGSPSACHQPGTSSSFTGSVHALAPPAEGALHLAVGVAAGEVLALVVGPLAAGEGQLDLDLPGGEVERERDERQPALLRLADEPLDLRLVQEQLPRAPRLVVRPAPLRVLRDVDVAQEDLAVVDGGEAVHQGRPTEAQRLHLGAGEHDAGLKDVLDRVVVPSLPVRRDDLPAGLPVAGGRLCTHVYSLT